MVGVTFNGKHSYKEWGLILADKDIGLPTIKTNIIDIPFMDGTLDLTNVLTDEPRYSNRKLQLTFNVIRSATPWATLLSKVANFIHGKKMEIVLDTDPEYFYKGYVSINEFKTDGNYSRVVLDCDCEPYKYNININKKWEWDKFSFIYGIIFNHTFNVNGKTLIRIPTQKKPETPIINVNSSMQLEFNSKTYQLESGENVPDIRFKEGINEFYVLGTGTVNIIYTGGSL